MRHRAAAQIAPASAPRTRDAQARVRLVSPDRDPGLLGASPLHDDDLLALRLPLGLRLRLGVAVLQQRAARGAGRGERRSAQQQGEACAGVQRVASEMCCAMRARCVLNPLEGIWPPCWRRSGAGAVQPHLKAPPVAACCLVVSCDSKCSTHAMH